jgi:hypothetical protein
MDTEIAENITIEGSGENETLHEESDFHQSEDEPNDHDLSIEERRNSSKSNDQKLWYEQLVLTYFEFPEQLKKKKKMKSK